MPTVQVGITVGNSGGTQTTHLAYFSATTTAYDFSEIRFLETLTSAAPGNFLLGPKEEDARLSFTETYANLKIAEQRKLSEFVYGLIYYKDIVDPRVDHITEYCTKVNAVDTTATSAVFEAAMCPTHNCADRECVDYQEVLRQLRLRKVASGKGGHL